MDNGYSIEQRLLISELECVANVDDMWFQTFFKGDLMVVKHMVRAHGKPSNPMPLSLAAYNGKMDVMEYLTNDLEMMPKDYSNYLVTTDQFGKVDGYIYSDVCYSGTQNEPLEMAAAGGHLEMIKFCEERLGCSANFNNGKAFEMATTCNRLDAVKYLVSKPGVNLANLTLYYAVRFANNMKMVKFLIEEMGIKATYMDAHGACEAGNLEMFKYLVQLDGVDSVSEHENSLHVIAAAASGNLQLLEYLVEERGMSTTGYNYMVLNDSIGNFPIFKFVAEHGCANAINNNTHALAFKIGALETLKYLVKNHGLDYDDYNSYFAYAIIAGVSSEFINYCLEDLGLTFSVDQFLRLIVLMLDEDAEFHHNLEKVTKLMLKMHTCSYKDIKYEFGHDHQVNQILSSLFEDIVINGVPLMVFMAVKISEGNPLFFQLFTYLTILSPQSISRLIREMEKADSTKESVIQSINYK